MRRYRTGILVTVLLFAAGGLAGVLVAQRFGPARLMAEVERRLSDSLGTPVAIERLRVSPGTFIRIDGDNLRAWPVEGGHGLEIGQVSGSVDAISLISGQIELRRFRVDGARLRLAPDGTAWSPVGSLKTADAASAGPTGIPNPDELLAPLISLETLVRRMLSAPRAASVVELNDVQISFEDDLAATSGLLALEGLSGRLVHHRFRRSSDISMKARLTEAGSDRGSVELAGHRARDGSIRISLRVGSLDLSTGARYVRSFRADAEIAGRLTGEWVYETAEPGTGQLQASLAIDELASSLPAIHGLADAIRSPRIDFVGTLGIDPQKATLNDFRITNFDTSLRVSGEISRPVRPESVARLDLELGNFDLGQARHLIGWLPEIEREEAAAFVAPLTSGRLEALRARGRSTLSGWQDLLAGRSRRMPRDFSMEAKLAEMVARFGDANRLEKLEAAVRWVGDRLEIEGATALLNGEQLPVLDVSIDGFPNFLAGRPELRRMDSGAEPLPGLGALWDALRPKPDSVSAEAGTQIDLAFEFLEHPLFLWPLWDGAATVVARPEGVQIASDRAIWAGVPIAFGGDWRFEPSERISLQLRASAPLTETRPPAHRDSWTRGRVEVGEMLGGRWQHHSARGSFEATGGRIRLRDVDIELAPIGLTRADALLDLSTRGVAPFRFNFSTIGGDASAIGKLVGLPDGQIEGSIDLDGSFEGELRPGTSVFQELSGLLEVSASEGAIRKQMPTVVAISEATAELESHDPGELVPFERVESILEFSGGRMGSASFSLDGPKLGVVASGSVDLAATRKTIDAQVYVFLFRKLDRVLGKIPILNRVLLGTDDNLVAAAFDVTGDWSRPSVKPILLPSSAGSTSQVLQGIPLFVMRGIRALGSIVKPGRKDDPAPTRSPDDPAVASPEAANDAT